jgi:hypothetical protein
MEEVIQIHRLLKNQIPVQEYVLFTENMYTLYQDNMIENWTKKRRYMIYKIKLFLQNFRQYQTQSRRRIRERSGRKRRYYHSRCYNK